MPLGDRADKMTQLYWDADKQTWMDGPYEVPEHFVRSAKFIYEIPLCDVNEIQDLKLDNQKGWERIQDLMSSFMGSNLDYHTLQTVEHHLATHFCRELSFALRAPILSHDQIKSNIITWASSHDASLFVLFSEPLVQAFDLKQTSYHENLSCKI